MDLMSSDGTQPDSENKPLQSTPPPFARLLKRERENNILMQQLASIERWSSATVSLASEVSGSANPREALEKLGNALVDELGFDYARMIWGDLVVEYPQLEELSDITSIEQLIAFEATGDGLTAMREMAGDLPFAGLHTAVGEAAGRAVYDATKDSVSVWMATMRRDEDF